MIVIPEEIKNLIQADGTRKNIRIHFPNGEQEDIINDSIVMDSVSYTESLCSENNLKFGLCEASTFSCKVNGIGRIKGSIIEVCNEIYCDDSIEGAVYKDDLDSYVYPINYGRFTVNSCERQSGTDLRYIEAYSDIISENSGVSLTPFQDWKMENSVAFSEGYIDYGFNALKAEIAGADELQWSSAWSPSTVRTKDAGSQELYYYRKGVNSENQQIYIRKYRVSITYDIYRDNITQTYAGNIGGFIEENKVYKFNYTDNAEARTEINKVKPYTILNVGGYGYFPQYATVPIDSAVKYSYDTDTETNPHFLYHADYLASQDTETGKVTGKYCNYKYKVDDNKVYYPYLPNSKRFANLSSFPQYETYAQINMPKKIRIREYDDSGTTVINDSTFNMVHEDVKYATLGQDTLPKIRVYFDTLIQDLTYPMLSRYVVSDESRQTLESNGIVNGYLELNGLFGSSDRTGEWKFFSINDSFALYPQEVLYPNGELYPLIASQNYQPLSTVSYQYASYEEYATHKYGYVRVSYLASDNEKYSITVECDSRFDNVYDMTENYVLLSRVFTPEQVRELILTYFYPNIKDIEYNPSNVTVVGLPFIEAGDLIKVYSDSGTFRTFVFRRTLKGEQSLSDIIEAYGDERNENADRWISVVDIVEES